ncbi:MAG: hypothetical protein DRJ63_01400 [Thermoprotei archaeon]|nr:MAG: hypothetical protein DRJ63_01400 [Thermoprotei archaeon]
MTPLTTFTIIFTIVILLLVTEIEHRAVVAMLAAVLSVYFGTAYGLFSFEEIVEMLNLDTVLFIVGILVLFETISESGFFDFLGLYLLNKLGSKSTLLVIVQLTLVTLFSGISSNITVMLIFGAITLKFSEVLGIDAKNTILVEGLQTNVGGILIPISSIPALIIATKTHMTFMEFMRISVPFIISLTVISLLISWILYYRKKSPVREAAERSRKTNVDPWTAVENPSALYRSLLIFSGFLVAIFMSEQIGLRPSFIAFFFVTISFLLSGVDPDKVFQRTDWSIPFFVAGFFIFVGGLERSGVLDKIAEGLVNILYLNPCISAPLLLLICAIISAFIDNIPVVLILYPIVKELVEIMKINPAPFYWALIIGGNLGGNLTTFGSPSVLIGVRLLERNDIEVTMGDYVKICYPIVVIQILASMLLLSLMVSLGLL